MIIRLTYGLLLLLVCCSFHTKGQVKTDTCLVRGFVYDSETGEPVAFTKVIANDVQVYAMTDYNGYYEMHVPRNDFEDGDEIVIEIMNLGFLPEIASVGFRDGQVIKNVYLEQPIDISFSPPEEKREVGMTKMFVLPPQEIPTISYGEGGGWYLQVLPGRRRNDPRVTIAGWSGPGSCLRIDVTYDDY